MDLIIEASPYIETRGSEKAKKDLYKLPFEVRRIANLSGQKPVKLMGFWESDNAFTERLNEWKYDEHDVLFTDWECKDMFHFQEITNKKKSVIITFNANEYIVNYSDRIFTFPVHPETVDDFINDLKRIGIKLFWKADFADIYGIENITSNKKIIEYYEVIKANGSSS